MVCSQVEPGSTLHVLCRADGRQAVVNLIDRSPVASAPKLLELINDRAAHPRVQACRDLAWNMGGRMYAAPSPLGGMAITLRFAAVIDE
jgi:hypothetical protein